MTGPGPGKLPVKAVVTAVTPEGAVHIEPCDVFIHVKGYSRARVTHVDIESPALSVRGSGGTYAYVHGIRSGFRVVPKNAIRARDLLIKELVVEWEGPELLEPGKVSIAYVGFKEGGIYVGFKKEVISRLEEFSRGEGVIPR